MYINAMPCTKSGPATRKHDVYKPNRIFIRRNVDEAGFPAFLNFFIGNDNYSCSVLQPYVMHVTLPPLKWSNYL